MTLIPNDYEKGFNEVFETLRKEIDALKAENKELRQCAKHDVMHSCRPKEKSRNCPNCGELQDDMRGFLHRHPMTEMKLALDSNHCIVDMEDWKVARKQANGVHIRTEPASQIQNVSDLLIAWEQFKKANWYESEAVDVEKMPMDKFQAIYGR